MNVIECAFLWIFATNLCDGANILGVFPSSGYSQFILCEKLMTELAIRGHNVTVISAYAPQHFQRDNYKTILVEGLVDAAKGDLYYLESENLFTNIKTTYEFGYLLTEYILAHKEVQELIHSNETFDLVVIEQFFNEAHIGFSSHFNTPFILFSSIGPVEWNGHLVGNMQLPSIFPNSYTGYTNIMGFFQRLRNVVATSFDLIYKHFVAFPIQQEILDKYFPNKMNLKEIMYNSSLMLLNSHVGTIEPFGRTNAMVEIGGFHITEEVLPENIQTFLDDASHGSIFFSMGSNLNSSSFSKDKQQAVINVVKKIKQKVLWKFESKDLLEVPKNLMISKWMPQSDILQHPSVVAFITHGGLLSITESIFAGVPMIGIPIFGDQKMNIGRMVQHNVAVHLPFNDLNEENLLKCINEIVDNVKYQENARKRSNILRDQIVRPLDSAMYWVQYVLRHKGMPYYLKNSSLYLNWFQLYLLDILTFVITASVMFCFLLKISIKTAFNSKNALANSAVVKNNVSKNKKKKKKVVKVQ